MISILCFCAVLAFAAGCGKDIPPSPGQDPAVLIIHIVSDGFDTRAAQVPGTESSAVDYQSTLEYKLTADKGGTADWRPATLDNEGCLYLFDVVAPRKIELRANGGQSSYMSLTDPLTDSSRLADVLPGKAPLYGSSGNFLYDGRMQHEGKEYQRLKTEVSMAIPISRIEISGIEYGQTRSKYKSLPFTAVYLNSAPAELYESERMTYHENPPGYLPKVQPRNPLNYAEQTHRPMLEPFTIEVGDASFEDGSPRPTVQNEVYAINFFPQGVGEGSLPVLTFYFHNAKRRSTGKDKYAFITQYTNSQTDAPITSFEPGKIYRITSLSIKNGNLHNEYYPTSDSWNVEAEVTVLPWKIAGATVDFTE